MAASVAVAGMVRALNPGEATGMVISPPVLMARRRVSHDPPRRQPLCTSTKATGTSDKTTEEWSSTTAAGFRVLKCGLRASCVWLAVGVSGHARTGRGEAGNVARERGGRRACACRSFRHAFLVVAINRLFLLLAIAKKEKDSLCTCDYRGGKAAEWGCFARIH